MSHPNRNSRTNKRYHANKWVDGISEKLSPHENAVLRQLIRMMDEEYVCFPSEATLCKLTSIGSRNTINAVTKRLAKEKLIFIWQKKKGKADYPCKHYKVTPPPEFIPGDDGKTNADNLDDSPLDIQIADWAGE